MRSNLTPHTVMVTLCLLPFLCGCDTPAKSVQWYQAHPEETETTWRRCLLYNEDSLDCEHAIIAYFDKHPSSTAVMDASDIPQLEPFTHQR